MKNKHQLLPTSTTFGAQGHRSLCRDRAAFVRTTYPVTYLSLHPNRGGLSPCLHYTRRKPAAPVHFTYGGVYHRAVFQGRLLDNQGGANTERDVFVKLRAGRCLQRRPFLAPALLQLWKTSTTGKIGAGVCDSVTYTVVHGGGCYCSCYSKRCAIEKGVNARPKGVNTIPSLGDLYGRRGGSCRRRRLLYSKSSQKQPTRYCFLQALREKRGRQKEREKGEVPWRARTSTRRR